MNADVIDDIGLKKVFFVNQPLVLENDSIYDVRGDYVVLLAREYNCRYGINCGDIMCGIIKREWQQTNEGLKRNWKVILPFNKMLLYAKFLNDRDIQLVRYYDYHLEHYVVSLQSDGTLNPSDYAFLLEETVSETQKSVSSSMTRTLKPKKKSLLSCK